MAMVVGKPAVARNDVKDHFASFEIKPELEFPKSRASHDFAQAGFILFTVQHQKPSAPRTRYFSADGPILPSEFVPGVDLRSGDPFGESLFRLPVDVQELPETPQIAFGYRIAYLEPDVLNFAQAPDDDGVLRARSLILFLQDGGGIAHFVGEEHQNVVLQTFEQVHVQPQARNRHSSVRSN